MLGRTWRRTLLPVPVQSLALKLLLLRPLVHESAFVARKTFLQSLRGKAVPRQEGNRTPQQKLDRIARTRASAEAAQRPLLLSPILRLGVSCSILLCIALSVCQSIRNSQ